MTTVTLESLDEIQFVVLKEIACQSLTIKNMVDDLNDAELSKSIPLPNVTGKILGKVIEYCTHHASETPASEDSKKTDAISPWDAEFCKVDHATLFDLIQAANYLNISSLLDLACKTVANMIKGKTPEEIRKTFSIKNDFTPEEEEQVRKENEWCEER